ncbi:MAG: hypothetical protein QNJ27_03715 [Simkaniaceae bacterium]|nr:hypothetical protein [Simkaniaceae bacterium]
MESELEEIQMKKLSKSIEKILKKDEYIYVDKTGFVKKLNENQMRF